MVQRSVAQLGALISNMHSRVSSSLVQSCFGMLLVDAQARVSSRVAWPNLAWLSLGSLSQTLSRLYAVVWHSVAQLGMLITNMQSLASGSLAKPNWA